MGSFVENPILNSPFRGPEKHWVLDGRGQPTGVEAAGRRNPGYVVPVAASRRGPVQAEMDLQEERTDNTLARL